jgi:hypothetical protein
VHSHHKNSRPCVKICYKERKDQEFDEESKRFYKEVEESRIGECQDNEKGFFSRIFDSEFEEFPSKARSVGRSKYWTRLSSGGIALSKKCERDPRNGLAGRINVEVFISFKIKSSKSEEPVSSRGKISVI